MKNNKIIFLKNLTWLKTNWMNNQMKIQAKVNLLVMSHSESGSCILNFLVVVMVSNSMHVSSVDVVDSAFDTLSGKICEITSCFFTKNTALNTRVKTGCLQVMFLSEVTYFFSTNDMWTKKRESFLLNQYMYSGTSLIRQPSFPTF